MDLTKVQNLTLVSDKGLYSTVYEIDFGNDEIYIIKIITDSVHTAVQEYFIQKCFHFAPEIIDFVNETDIELLFDKFNVKYRKTEVNLGIVMKRYDIDLSDLMDEDAFGEYHIEKIILCLSEYVSIMHVMNIAHVDIKSDNILIDIVGDDINVVLADYGVSSHCYDIKLKRHSPLISPDSFNIVNPIKEDCFMFGIFLYNLVTRQHYMLKRENVFDVFDRCIVDDDIVNTYSLCSDNDDLPNGINPEDIFKELRDNNYYHIGKDLINKVYNILCGLLVATPENRISMEDVYEIISGKKIKIPGNYSPDKYFIKPMKLDSSQNIRTELNKYYECFKCSGQCYIYTKHYLKSIETDISLDMVLLVILITRDTERCLNNITFYLINSKMIKNILKLDKIYLTYFYSIPHLEEMFNMSKKYTLDYLTGNLKDN